MANKPTGVHEPLGTPLDVFPHSSIMLTPLEAHNQILFPKLAVGGFNNLPDFHVFRSVDETEELGLKAKLLPLPVTRCLSDKHLASPAFLPYPKDTLG